MSVWKEAVQSSEIMKQSSENYLTHQMTHCNLQFVS